MGMIVILCIIKILIHISHLSIFIDNANSAVFSINKNELNAARAEFVKAFPHSRGSIPNAYLDLLSHSMSIMIDFAHHFSEMVFTKSSQSDEMCIMAKTHVFSKFIEDISQLAYFKMTEVDADTSVYTCQLDDHRLYITTLGKNVVFIGNNEYSLRGISNFGTQLIRKLYHKATEDKKLNYACIINPLYDIYCVNKEDNFSDIYSFNLNDEEYMISAYDKDMIDNLDGNEFIRISIDLKYYDYNRGVVAKIISTVLTEGKSKKFYLRMKNSWFLRLVIRFFTYFRGKKFTKDGIEIFGIDVIDGIYFTPKDDYVYVTCADFERHLENMNEKGWGEMKEFEGSHGTAALNLSMPIVNLVSSLGLGNIKFVIYSFEGRKTYGVGKIVHDKSTQ
eukprot:TRINITY_DN1954_c0_g1_i2.p1 TRINITY_DN1954_c0_g1~~TRINITY_DN1954_c0_g1_i2.p1  ORF type:complete len:391 (+),score=63.33 TRINITY_DN1954_c0_g1_i2:302-1474(+)